MRNGNTRVGLVGMGVDNGGSIDSAVSHQRESPLIPDFELAVFYITDTFSIARTSGYVHQRLHRHHTGGREPGKHFAGSSGSWHCSLTRTVVHVSRNYLNIGKICLTGR